VVFRDWTGFAWSVICLLLFWSGIKVFFVLLL
jgi:hypothetical protein